MDEQRSQVRQASAAALLAASSRPAQADVMAPGNPGDFDFLTGEWRIAHRRLRAPGDWDAFEGEATCWGILGGICSVEELRIPARNFSGMGLRLLNLQTRVWSDHWVNAVSGALGASRQTGGFVNGVGAFGADEMDGDALIKVRGIWDNISPTTTRWRQAVSRDNGASWEENWIMDWRRAG